MTTNPARRLISWLSVLAASVILAGSLPAQPAEPPLVSLEAIRFEPEQLEELLGPIALYPDALIALILPASTATSDVVLAARFLRDGGDAAQAETQPWDDSVQALAHYADVVKWMDENLAWTKQLGEAFLAQPADVMNAIQRLRAKAQAAGTLTSTPEQQVIVQQSAITILPTQPDVIYVPYYDPEIVYVPQPVYYGAARPYFRFSSPFSTGFWLSFNLDWHSHRVWCVNRNDRERYWRESRQYWHRPSPWGQPGYAARPNYYRAWTPRPHHVASHRSTTVRHTATVARPRFAGGAEARNDSSHRENRRDGRTPSNRPGYSYASRSAHVPGTPRAGTLSTGPSAGVSTIPHLQLAEPLANSSPAVSRQTPARPEYQRSDRTRGSSTTRADRSDRSSTTVTSPRGQAHRGNPPSPVGTRSVSRQVRPAPSSPAITYSPRAPHVPAAQPAPARPAARQSVAITAHPAAAPASSSSEARSDRGRDHRHSSNAAPANQANNPERGNRGGRPQYER